MRLSHGSHTRKPLRLLALGGAALVDSGGAVVAAQRRRLALLILVAAGRLKGVSRDKLVSYLNPESSTESARHALHQLLYYIRQQAGDDVLLGTDPLRVNPDVVTSDVWDFEDALDRGDLDTAVALYRGSFLDGFHVSDSVQFEEWSAAERARLAALNTDALFRLAVAADERNDHNGAIRWWTKLAALDSLSGRSATGLIQAYAAAGDVPAALRHAAIHDSVVRSELGTEPDVTAAALTAALLKPTPAVPPAAQMPEHTIEPHAAPAPPAHARRYGSPLIGLAVAASAAAVLFSLTPFRTDPVASPGLVAVMPFRVTAADSATMWLRDGLVELLSIRLADARGLGPIDPRIAIASWARAGGTTRGDAPQRAVLAEARLLGASHVVTGSAIVSGGEVLISAGLVAVASERTVAEVEARGRVDSVVRLIDTIAVRLVSIQGGEDMLRGGVLGATSVPAVRSYLDGRAALRLGDWAGAVDAFERALAFDSTFASAALGLRDASGLYNGMRTAYAESLAWRYQDRLTPRERSTFRAELGPNHPAWYPAADRLKAWRAVTSSDFANADAWRELGLTYYHNGARIGAPNAWTEARIALEQSLELDATHGFGPRMQLLAIAAVTADSALYDRVVRGEPVASTDTAVLAYRRWLRAFTRRDSLAVIAARPRLADASDNDLTSIWSLTQKAGWDVQDADRAQAIIAARGRTFNNQPVASIQYHLALNRGRPAEAQAVAPRLMPEWRPLSRLALQVLSALYGDGDQDAGSTAAKQLVSEVERPLARDAAELRSQMIHVCVSAQWSLAHGDTRLIDVALAKLRTPEPGAVGSIVAFYETCAATIAAWRSVVEHRPGSRVLLNRLDSLLLTGTPWHWALPEYRVAARLWEMTDEPVLALAAIRRRRMDITNYLAADLGEEGRLALAAGDTVGALAAWRHYLALRSHPEPVFKPKAEAIRREVDRFSAGLTSSNRP